MSQLICAKCLSINIDLSRIATGDFLSSFGVAKAHEHNQPLRLNRDGSPKVWNSRWLPQFSTGWYQSFCREFANPICGRVDGGRVEIYAVWPEPFAEIQHFGSGYCYTTTGLLVNALDSSWGHGYGVTGIRERITTCGICSGSLL